jgi:hypothetical protein
MPKKQTDPAITERELERQKARYTVISECVTLSEAWVRRYSKNEAAQVAKEGYEKPFQEELRRKQILQDILREIGEKIDDCRRALYGT